MADINEEVKVSGVFGGVGFEQDNQQAQGGVFKTVSNNGENLLAKVSVWSKVKDFLFQEIDWNKEIKVELTPHQQKIENEINEFLHQEITWQKVHDFLFQEITFGKKNK